MVKNRKKGLVLSKTVIMVLVATLGAHSLVTFHPDRNADMSSYPNTVSVTAGCGAFKVFPVREVNHTRRPSQVTISSTGRYTHLYSKLCRRTLTLPKGSKNMNAASKLLVAIRYPPRHR